MSADFVLILGDRPLGTAQTCVTGQAPRAHTVHTRGMPVAYDLGGRTMDIGPLVHSCATSPRRVTSPSAAKSGAAPARPSARFGFAPATLSRVLLLKHSCRVRCPFLSPKPRNERRFRTCSGRSTLSEPDRLQNEF